MDRSAVQTWVTDLFAAWQNADPSRAAALFTPNAVYRSHPFQPPLEGRAAITSYWERAVEGQADLEVHVGSAVVEGDRAAVEWWVSLTEAGAASVSSGSLFLTFSGGLCSELREVWTEREGTAQPYDGWGK